MWSIPISIVIAYAVWAFRDIALRVLLVKSTEVAATDKLRAESTIPPVPMGLILFANEESEDWAREAVMKRIKELYVEHGDWSLVESTIRRESEK